MYFKPFKIGYKEKCRCDDVIFLMLLLYDSCCFFCFACFSHLKGERLENAIGEPLTSGRFFHLLEILPGRHWRCRNFQPPVEVFPTFLMLFIVSHGVGASLLREAQSRADEPFQSRHNSGNLLGPRLLRSRWAESVGLDPTVRMSTVVTPTTWGDNYVTGVTVMQFDSVVKHGFSSTASDNFWVWLDDVRSHLSTGRLFDLSTCEPSATGRMPTSVKNLVTDSRPSVFV